MEKDWPAIVSVVDRGASGFGATSYDTFPLPVPVAPDLSVTHVAPLVAVQLHPASEVSETEVQDYEAALV